MLGDEIGAVAEFPRTGDSNCEWTLLNRGSVSPINKFSGSHHPQEPERGALTTGVLIPPPQTHLFFATAAYLLIPRPVGPLLASPLLGARRESRLSIMGLVPFLQCYLGSGSRGPRSNLDLRNSMPAVQRKMTQLLLLSRLAFL